MCGIYLNNAATSYPKPPAVIEAVSQSLRSPPVEPGRSGGEVGDPLAACRRQLAELFGVARPEQVALLPSATSALNQVLWGILSGREHVVTTVLEHNSVLRPLHHLGRQRGVEVTHVEPEPDGTVTEQQLASALRPDTRLLVVSHASNVTGTVQPVEGIAALAADRGVPLLIDAAQSAGCLPIAHERLPGRVFVAFAGHKGLLGPTGVGGLVVADNNLGQTIFGGTGIRSELLSHPQELPLRHEAGTPNLPGCAGLAAGLQFLAQRGVETEGRHRHRLVTLCRELLQPIPGITLLPLGRDDGRAGVVSFTVRDLDAGEVAYVLRSSFGIETRAGLHCAPLLHRYLGTAPQGTVRISFGTYNRPEHVERLVGALECLVRR